MDMSKILAWFNFKTQEYEYRQMPEDFTDYLPQNPAAQSLYGLLTGCLGQTPVEAARSVLCACCGKERDESKD
jgi:hypothetical protein